MLKPIVLLITIGCGAAVGWQAGAFGGLMGSYLTGVVGASAGLYIGRRIQANMD